MLFDKLIATLKADPRTIVFTEGPDAIMGAWRILPWAWCACTRCASRAATS